MNSVEKVKAICKERKIPISRLERELGYANGYISQLRKGTFPSDRLIEIANYLNVSVAELTEEQKESPAPKGAGQSPGYENLNEAIKVIVQTMIAQLLAAQSDD